MDAKILSRRFFFFSYLMWNPGSPKRIHLLIQEMWEAWVQSLGWEDALEEGMAIHSPILAWRIPWTDEPGRIQSMGSQRAGHDWATEHNVEPKHQSDQHNQAGANDFQHLIWIFLVCPLSPAWYNIGCSPLMSWSLISFNWCTLTVEHCPVRNLHCPTKNYTNHFWHIRPVIAPSPYTTQNLFFAFQLDF